MSNNISVLISEEELNARIRELGEQITRDYQGKEIVLICILKGSVFYSCELAKHIGVPVQLEFMRCSSYGDSHVSSGNVRLMLDLDIDIAGRNVIVVEDIVDTGRTLYYLMGLLSDRKPASLRLTTLLDKPDRRVKEVNVDYVGFNIPDKFVVGYGLDFAQNYRNLPYIGVIEK